MPITYISKVRYLVIGGLAAVVAADDLPTVVPVHEEPRHSLVFEKHDVRVFNTVIPAGDTSLYHAHRDPTFYVIIGMAKMRNQDLGEDWTTIGPPPGSPPGPYLFRDYRARPQTHRVNNIDDHTFHVIGVINHGEGGDGAAVTGIAPEVENPWFRAYRFRLEPGQASAPHRHDGPVVLVQVNDGQSVMVENGVRHAEKTVGGTWSWHEPAGAHRLLNPGGGGVELMEIEIR